jgi:hypothetical protein
MNMSKSDQTQLWEGLSASKKMVVEQALPLSPMIILVARRSANKHLYFVSPIDDYDKFWGMNQRLTLNDGTMARNLPVRIYLPENCPVIQEPMSPVDENGQQARFFVILVSEGNKAVDLSS